MQTNLKLDKKSTRQNNNKANKSQSVSQTSKGRFFLRNKDKSAGKKRSKRDRERVICRNRKVGFVSNIKLVINLLQDTTYHTCTM